MWDAILAKGDDDYYETSRIFREEDSNEGRKTKRPHRKGKRI